MGNPTGSILRPPIVQTVGSDVKKIMSQKSVTDQLNTKVPTSRKVNGKALTADVTLVAADVGAYSKSEIDTKFSERPTAVPLELVTESKLVTEDARLIVVMSDGISKTIGVNDGLAEAATLEINATDWDIRSSGLMLAVDFGDEVWTTGLSEYSVFEFTKPGIVEFTKFQGKWRITKASGEVAQVKTPPPPWIKLKDADPSGIHYTGPFSEVVGGAGSTVRYRWEDENTLHFVGIARCTGVVPTGTIFITLPAEVGNRVSFTDWSPATRANDNGSAYIEVLSNGLRAQGLSGTTTNITAWVMINVVVILEEM